MAALELRFLGDFEVLKELDAQGELPIVVLVDNATEEVIQRFEHGETNPSRIRKAVVVEVARRQRGE